MAQIIQHPRAQTTPVVQTRKVGRLPKSVVSLGTVKRDRSFAKYEANCLQEEIATTLHIAREWEKVGLSYRLQAEALKQRARSTK